MTAITLELPQLREVKKLKVKKAVIPAAGFGTRFLPITKVISKELLPIIDRPAIEYIVKEAIEAGIEEILLIISPHKTEVIDYFKTNNVLEEFLNDKKNYEAIKLINEFKNIKIDYAIQKEQLGLGHAILHAKEFVKNEPFAVLLGDDLFYSDTKPAIKQLIDAFKTYDGHIIGTMTVPDEDTVKYGICKTLPNQKGPVYELDDFIEKPQPHEVTSRSAASGRYILKPIIFKYLETQSKGKGGEIQLTDAILRSKVETKLYSFDLDAKRYDIGSKEGYLKAIVEYSLRRDDLKDKMKEIIKNNS